MKAATLWSGITKGVGGFSVGLAVCSFIISVLMMATVVTDVFGRQVLDSPLPGTYIIVSYWYMVGFVFLPVAYVQYRRKHLKVTVFTMKLPDIAKGILDIIGLGFMVAIFGAFTLHTWNTAVEAMHFGTFIEEAWNIPIWPAYFYLPLGAGAVTLQAFVHLIEDTYSLIKKGKIEAHVASVESESL